MKSNQADREGGGEGEEKWDEVKDLQLMKEILYNNVSEREKRRGKS